MIVRTQLISSQVFRPKTPYIFSFLPLPQLTGKSPVYHERWPEDFVSIHLFHLGFIRNNSFNKRTLLFWLHATREVCFFSFFLIPTHAVLASLLDVCTLSCYSNQIFLVLTFCIWCPLIHHARMSTNTSYSPVICLIEYWNWDKNIAHLRTFENTNCGDWGRSDFGSSNTWMSAIDEHLTWYYL